MGRYIFNGVTGLSLLVCLSTVIFWIRSNWRIQFVCGGGLTYRWLILMEPGAASLTLDTNPRRPQERSESGSYPVAERAHWMWWVEFGIPGDIIEPPEWHVPGLTFHSAKRVRSSRPTEHTNRLVISYWLIVLLTLILPASRIRFRKRTLPGHCPNCHYDLRATPERCPERGMLFK
jgi:hypothetical protein